MSEKEVRELLEQFCEEVDEGRVRTALHRLRVAKLIGAPLLALTLGLGACGDDADDQGPVNDYAGVFPQDVGPINDYAAPWPEDLGPVADYAAPFDVLPPDGGPINDYAGPFPADSGAPDVEPGDGGAGDGGEAVG